jgi:hypothetical protein
MTNFKQEFLDGFWPIWPNKVAKIKAMKFYRMARQGSLVLQRLEDLGPATKEEILAGVERYKRTKEDWRAWLHPSTYLYNCEWLSEGGSEVIEPERDNTAELAMQRRDHEAGREMYPSLAAKHGWAEYGSAAPKLRMVK